MFALVIIFSVELETSLSKLQDTEHNAVNQALQNAAEAEMTVQQLQQQLMDTQAALTQWNTESALYDVIIYIYITHTSDILLIPHIAVSFFWFFRGF